MPRIHLLPEDPDLVAPRPVRSPALPDQPVVATGRRPINAGIWWLAGLAWLVAAAFALRVISLDWQSFWLDEVDAIRFARGDLRALLGMFVRTGENGPLYFLILRPWTGAVGTTEFAVRYLSLLAGVLSVPLAWAVGTRLFDRRTGLLAAALTAGAPYLIWYSQEAKMYALVAALSLLSTYLLLRAARENRWTFWAGYVVAASLGYYLHLYGVFLLAGQIAAYVATVRWHPQSVRRWLIATACLTLPYLPLAVWQLPLLIEAPPLAHGAVALPEMLRILFNRFSVNQETWPAPYLIAPWILALIAGVAVLVRPVAPRASRLWLAAWLVVPVIIVFVLTLRLPVFRDRYLTIVTPAYYLLLAAGLARLPRPTLTLPVIGLALALSAGVALAAGPLTRTDFRAAANYYAAHRQPGDVVGFEATYAARPFLWYAPPDTQLVEFPYTDDGMTPEEAAAWLTAATAGSPRVWFVEHEEWLWDGRRLVYTWLERNGRLVQQVEFPGVRVSLYRMTR